MKINVKEADLNSGGIYKISNNINKKFYIGSTNNFKTRIHDHVYKLKAGKHREKFQRSVDKHGIENFTFEILEILIKEELENREQYNERLKEIEQRYLDENFPINKGKHLYNTQSKAKQRLGPWSYSPEETAKKISVAHMGKKISEETKKKMSEVSKKRWSNEGYREAHSGENSHRYGKTNTWGNHTPETLEKLRISNSGKNNPMYGTSGEKAPFYGKRHTQETLNKMSKEYTFLSPTGEVIVIQNLHKFCRENGLTGSCMCAVASGNRKSHNGWTIPGADLSRKYKTYIFISPAGEEVVVNDLIRFCLKNNLSKGTLYQVASGKRKSHKGWVKSSVSAETA